MNIINNYCSPNFQANLNSPKLKFSKNDFFVNIPGYGKDYLWAKGVKDTADLATNLIRRDTSAENVLKIITFGIIKANQILRNFKKAFHTGILRYEREGWKHGSDWDGFLLCTNYSDIPKYSTYADRFDKVVGKPLKKPYPDIGLTRPKIEGDEKFLEHANPRYINNAFRRVFKLYDDVIIIHKKDAVNNDNLEKINKNIAELRWILAHSTPWERGSDAISNVFTRSLYKAVGIKTYPLKKDISLDLEAYCTELNEFKQKFPTYFEKPPEIIE